ncbi:MAG: DUF4351 domain-containing protein [Halochromatium sp.]
MLAERVIEWTQDWKQQGYDSGFGEGFGEGFDKGEAALLERQLRKRFGPLDADTEARLQAASSAEIERWAERIFDARQLADVFAGEAGERAR